MGKAKGRILFNLLVCNKKPELRSFGVGVKAYCTSSRSHLPNERDEGPSMKSLLGITDYTKERKNFRIEVPQHYNFATDVIDKWALTEKDDEAFASTSLAFWYVSESGKEMMWNYQELSALSKRYSRILEGINLRHGDRLVLILPKIPEWWLLNVACIRSGIIMSPGTTMLRCNDIAHRLNAFKAKCIIASPEVAAETEEIIEHCPTVEQKVVISKRASTEQLESDGWTNFYSLLLDDDICAEADHVAAETRADEPMTVFFTSGTTGQPKMTEHTHVSYGLALQTTGRHWLDLTPSDIHWNLSDPGWAKSAWSNVFAPWIQGSCVFIHEMPKFDANHVMKILCDYPISSLCAPPTAYRLMIGTDMRGYRFNKSLRSCVSAGEPMNSEVIDRWHKHSGLYIREGYGQTETTLLCATYPSIPIKPGSMGKPAPGYDIKIIDDDCKEVDIGEEGHIAIRCKPDRPVGLFKRYVDDAEHMVAAFRGDYYLTGDRAYRDADGYLWFVSRSDDIILSAGYRIGPFEVESALLEHLAVLESAVVSSPDPTRGEVVKAFVVLTQKYLYVDKWRLALDLQEHCKSVTAAYKYPRKIEFVTELPKTVSGKIRRIELREREWATATNGTPSDNNLENY